MIPTPRVSRVTYRCERCGGALKLRVLGSGERYCLSCVRILVRLATV